MDFFGDIIESLQTNGFAPLRPSEKSKATYTLHNALRDRLGMAERKEVQSKLGISEEGQVHITSDMADVAFWNYKDLRRFLTQIHEILDQEVSEITGRPTNAIAWSHASQRTTDEIIDLLDRSRRKYPDLEIPGAALRRPMAKLMVQKRRVEAAVANTFAVLVGNGCTYGNLFNECSELNLSNEKLLDFLDSRIKQLSADIQKIDEESLVPRQLVISYFHHKSLTTREEAASPTITQFLGFLKRKNNLAGVSDSVLLSQMNAGVGNSEDLVDD